jgi:hypothetical protein
MMIKVFLIGSVLAVTLFLIRGGSSGRHLAVRRLTSIAFASCWVIAVIAPDLVTQVANVMGVGRGTDLVLYALVVAFLFSTVAQRQQLRELDDRVAELTRELALREVAEPGGTDRAGSSRVSHG